MHLQVDKKTREIHAEIHSAQHLFCGYINKKYNAATIAFFNNESETGAEMGFHELNDEILQEIEKSCNEFILQDLPLEILYPKLEDALQYVPVEKTNHQELRAVKIGDIDYNLCACIHVPSLRYLQAMKILSYEKTTRGYRIYFVVGKQLLANYHAKNKRCLTLTKLLASPENKIVSNIEKLLMEKKKNTQYIQALLDDKMKVMAANIIKDNREHECFIIEKVDAKFLSKLANEICAQSKKVLFVLLKDKEETRFVLAKSNNHPTDLQNFFQNIKNKYGAKGGGNLHLFQGTCSVSAEVLQDEYIKYYQINSSKN